MAAASTQENHADQGQPEGKLSFLGLPTEIRESHLHFSGPYFPARRRFESSLQRQKRLRRPLSLPHEA
jgi:hypothetical protein